MANNVILKDINDTQIFPITISSYVLRKSSLNNASMKSTVGNAIIFKFSEWKYDNINDIFIGIAYSDINVDISDFYRHSYHAYYNTAPSNIPSYPDNLSNEYCFIGYTDNGDIVVSYLNPEFEYQIKFELYTNNREFYMNKNNNYINIYF